MDLTDRQKECINFISRFIKDYGYPPTIQEICNNLGIRSKNAGFKLLNALESKGFIRRNRSISRGIELLKINNGIPILGRITAGIPIDAEENIEGYIPLEDILGDISGYFGLRVIGDSMVEKGILDGDIAIIKKQPDILNNQVGAFMINGEFTLKTFKMMDDGRIYLKPENNKYKPIYITENDTFEVVGLLKMVVRLFGEDYEARKY
ncbi:transcriptional repressor LexA [Calditerrivibrio nitroreducens]|uniref:LexA repressor n=1 Tax=Calditerrivibrio nitroreducens (strain DSM 19672 / NBRC 101217 / Yu37-1) TaxID=768670 RepID=E4TG52_CALNY|nr:transcriptional repressor LexA [Calditerrivibrio nitroreducens]ADR18602.1 transcriptional repressor, LexA family [Calditerrivibrio nitroreducens DSM 19672]